MSRNDLHGWVFTYNQYTNKWYAAKREHFTELFSNLQSDNVIGSSKRSTLEELIQRTGGDKKKIEALCR